MLLLKTLLLGGPRIVFKLFGDIGLAFMRQIKWQVIIERLLTRVMAGCLNWLASLSTNQIYKATVMEILKDFQDRGLAKAVAYEARRIKRDNSGD